MKNAGLLIVVISILLLILALFMDTSVQTASGDRVNNMGLMNDQQNYITISCAVGLSGLILFLFGILNNSNAELAYTVCAQCDVQVELDLSEIKKKMYRCPECKKINLVGKINSSLPE